MCPKITILLTFAATNLILRAFPLLAPTLFDVALNRFKGRVLVHVIEFFMGNLVVWSKLGPDLWFQRYGMRNVYSKYAANHWSWRVSQLWNHRSGPNFDHTTRFLVKNSIKWTTAWHLNRLRATSNCAGATANALSGNALILSTPWFYQSKQ